MPAPALRRGRPGSFGFAGIRLALSDRACWIGWTACARAGRVETGASSIHAATADTALRRKGLKPLINAESSILLGRVEMRGVDHEFRQRPAEAIMDALRKLGATRRAEQVEISASFH